MVSKIFIGKYYKMQEAPGHVKITGYSIKTDRYSGEWYYKDSATECQNYWNECGKCCVSIVYSMDLVQECNWCGEVEDSWGYMKFRSQDSYRLDKEEPCKCGCDQFNNWTHKPDCEYVKWNKWKQEQLKKQRK